MQLLSQHLRKDQAGAYQNRLEHTINNSTSSENLTAAESVLETLTWQRDNGVHKEQHSTASCTSYVGSG